jgi:thiol-disulfide isomerase/thioredoxin
MNRVSRFFVALGIMALSVPLQAKRTPNLEFKNLQGATEKTADLRGSITVINFWATFCGPCREEMPRLSSLAQEYSAKKVRFVAISADESPDDKKNRAKIDEFLSKEKPGMEIWLGADLDTLARLQLGNVLPATLIVDQDGEVVSRIMGEVHDADVRGALDWLLNGRNGPAPPATIKRY